MKEGEWRPYWPKLIGYNLQGNRSGVIVLLFRYFENDFQEDHFWATIETGFPENSS